jgi:hypothetical protein
MPHAFLCHTLLLLSEQTDSVWLLNTKLLIGSTGNDYDYACVKSFFATLKRARVHDAVTTRELRSGQTSSNILRGSITENIVTFT